MKNSISFFDFDGTLTRKDSLLEFVKFYKGNSKTYAGVLFLTPYLVAMKAGLISTQKGKEKLLSYFFKGEDIEEFNARCSVFAAEVIPKIIRKDGLETLDNLLAEKQEICVVTASPENWVAPYFEKIGVKVLGTKLEVKANKITGKIVGENCKGVEKVRRIIKEYDLSTFENIAAYGDTAGDKEMLSIATQKFYRFFKG